MPLARISLRKGRPAEFRRPPSTSRLRREDAWLEVAKENGSFAHVTHAGEASYAPAAEKVPA